MAGPSLPAVVGFVCRRFCAGKHALLRAHAKSQTFVVVVRKRSKARSEVRKSGPRRLRKSRSSGAWRRR